MSDYAINGQYYAISKCLAISGVLLMGQTCPISSCVPLSKGLLRTETLCGTIT